MKMDVVIVGSVAIDNITTPFSEMCGIVGGSAVYSAIASAKSARTGIIGVAGYDCFDDIKSYLLRSNVDIQGIEVKDGVTFRWHGRYFANMNERETLSLDLGVFSEFQPKVPDAYKETKVLFLANIDPELQQDVLDAVDAQIVALDTMDHWIASKKGHLVDVLQNIDLIFLNDGEARQLTGEHSIIKAGKALLSMGLRYAVIKKGEHGSIFFGQDRIKIVPAFPLEEVVDPTGAGDSYAGAFLGRWAAYGLRDEAIEKALMYASAASALCVEGFGVNRLVEASSNDIEDRVNLLRRYTI